MLFNKLSIYTKFFNVSIVIVIHLHSRRIGKLHRIAETIQVSVVVQPVILVGNERIGAEETACGWFVDDSFFRSPFRARGMERSKGFALGNPHDLTNYDIIQTDLSILLLTQGPKIKT